MQFKRVVAAFGQMTPASDKVAAGQWAVNVEAAGLQKLLTQVSIEEQRSGPTRPDFLLTPLTTSMAKGQKFFTIKTKLKL